MPRLSRSRRGHDPFWDLDGEGARRARTQRRFVRLGTWLVVALVIALMAIRLPDVDTEFLLQSGGRPLLAGALMTLLGTFMLLGLARIRRPQTD